LVCAYLRLLTKVTFCFHSFAFPYDDIIFQQVKKQKTAFRFYKLTKDKHFSKISKTFRQ